MKGIITFLQAKIAFLEHLSAQAEKSLAKNQVSPKFRLRISKSNGVSQYYLLQETGETQGKYLEKANLPLARNIAQRDYDNYIKKHAAMQVKMLKKCLKTLSAGNFLTHENHPRLACGKRRPLVAVHFLSNEEFAAQWQSKPYKSKPFTEDTPVIKTNKDERVRSKSEKIIADKLNEMGIPYKYECPLKINWPVANEIKSITIYPDFTLLDTANRREIILEHFGMMDDPEYAKNAVEKIAAYGEAGYISGKTFLFSMETKNNPLNAGLLEKIVRASLMA